MELGKAMGAKVIATSTQEKIDLCKNMVLMRYLYPTGKLNKDQQKELSKSKN